MYPNDIQAALEALGRIWDNMERRRAICAVAGVDDIGELSDGFHTFNNLYEQRAILFAALVRAYKDKSWKSYRHEDGELCFGGGWFIVGIDTPKGSYTYHYENKYWDLFDCVELPRGKHWDGHTEADAETRLMSLSPELEDDWYEVEYGNSMNNDEFKIGDRVFFTERHGLGVFGNVEKVDHDGQCLLVRADDMRLYKIFGDKVTNLSCDECETAYWILLDECSNPGYYCSNCGKKLVKEGWSNTVKKINYCPNCGKKMEAQHGPD